MATKHIHHVIPLHMGGTDEPSNLIELTIAEHRAKVVKTLKHGPGEKNSMFGKFGKDNPHFGMKRTDETGAKISASRKGHKASEETKAKMRAAALRRWIA
jgi:hypothetical protein